MIYHASPSDNSAQQQWNSLIANNLRAHGHEVMQEQEIMIVTGDAKTIGSLCRAEIKNSWAVVVNADAAMEHGLELGLAIAWGKKTIAYRTNRKAIGQAPWMDKVDAFVNKPLGSYSDVCRSILGYLERFKDE